MVLNILRDINIIQDDRLNTFALRRENGEGNFAIAIHTMLFQENRTTAIILDFKLI